MTATHQRREKTEINSSFYSLIKTYFVKYIFSNKTTRKQLSNTSCVAHKNVSKFTKEHRKYTSFMYTKKLTL